jgi:S1-C subfamily serine protease
VRLITWSRRLGLAAALAAGVLIGWVVFGRSGSPPPLDRAQVGTIASAAANQAIKAQQAAPANSEVVYQKVLPSVVAIEAQAGPAKSSEEDLGAGVIVNTKGAILTALHVVRGAKRIRVSFADGTQSSALVASTDPGNDIAVLTPTRTPTVLVPAVLGGGVRVGDAAYALGHPLGYVDSLTAGVVSGLDRSVEEQNGQKLHGLIQFDAAVNPGNSGGPLLNRGGQVIGIVTSLASPAHNRYFIGIGFAVPIGTAGGAANAPSK